MPPHPPALIIRLDSWLEKNGLPLRELREIALAQIGLSLAITGLAVFLLALPPSRELGLWCLWAAVGAWTSCVNFLLLSRTGLRIVRHVLANIDGKKPRALPAVFGILLKLFITAAFFCVLTIQAGASIIALLCGFTLGVLAILGIAFLGNSRA